MNIRLNVTRVLPLAVFFCLIGGSVSGQEANPIQETQSSIWQRYTVKGEQFSIELPTVPAMTTYRQRGQLLGKDRVERHLGVYADGVVYTIFSLDDGDPRGAQKRSINAMLSSPSWERATEQDLSVNGLPGKQYFSRSSVGGTVQIFATKNRFYRFQAFGATAENPQVQRFFSSLSLGKDVKGIEVSDGTGVLLEPTAEFAATNLNPAGNPFTGKEVDRKPLLIMKTEPAYTEAARKNGITGTVVLKVVFSSHGSVINIRTVSGLPDGLTERTIEAAKKIKFIPAVKDGKFVSMWMQLEYNFNLY